MTTTPRAAYPLLTFHPYLLASSCLLLLLASHPALAVNHDTTTSNTQIQNNNNPNNFSTNTASAFISNHNYFPSSRQRRSSTKDVPKYDTSSFKSKALFYTNTPDDNEDEAAETQPPNRDKNQPKNNNIMRAWTCHGRNQRDLVDRMMQAKIVRTDSVRDVLYQVDRQNYAPPSQERASPYMDAPQPIGLGQTISAPHMHAHVLEEIYPYLKDSPASQVKILDVGCGSGYLTAALGRWVAPLQGPPEGEAGTANAVGGDDNHNDSHNSGSLLSNNKTGLVYGIDIYPHLVELTRQNMKKQDNDLLNNKIVTLQESDGWKGLPDASPFDAIHVGAAAAEFPRALLEQLKVGGILIIPVGPEGGVQNLYRVERLSDGFTQEDFRITELLGVRYVPLVQQSDERRN